MARSIYTEQEAQFLKNIGYRVQFFRKKAGLSQEELAERCGMSYSTISHIESTSPYPIEVLPKSWTKVMRQSHFEFCIGQDLTHSIFL